MFSLRTSWARQHNRLTQILDSRRAYNLPVHDLTNSNPTECGIPYPGQEIRDALSGPEILQHHPDPRGLISARTAIASEYQKSGVRIDPQHLFLTASTSEAYSILFRLLCNPGDSILIPQPSYPLFDYLAQINDVSLGHYRLRYDGEWRVDIDSIRNSISSATRAIVIVHPHNPTGLLLHLKEYDQIKEIAHRHKIAVIVDEVFIEYHFDGRGNPMTSAMPGGDGLIFTLNGISKMLGLPQLKLGWIVVGGEKKLVDEALGRIEIISDTFLSVNTPVQIALPKLFSVGLSTQKLLLDLVRSNYSLLQQCIGPGSPVSLLNTVSGWYAILRVPRTKIDEVWSIELLEKRGILIYPGYYFDFEEEGFLVISLLVESEIFHRAGAECIEYIQTHA